MPVKPSKIDQTWPRVRPVNNQDGTVSYMVDTRIAGKGKRLFYPTKVEAQTVAEQARIKRRNEGLGAFSMSASDRVDAENALEILRRHGISLKSAADFSLRHLSTITTPMLVGDVVEEYLRKMKQDGKSDFYFNTCSSLWKRFAADHAELRVGDITPAMTDEWLRGLDGISGDTRNGYAALLSSLFKYSVRHKYTVENPMAAYHKAKSERGIPKILTIPQVITLLRSAEPRFMPCLLLGLFAGLRPWSEVCRLRWERIDFEKKRIDIAPGMTKNQKSVRFVQMSDNLVQWLLPYRKPSGLVIQSEKLGTKGQASIDAYNDLRERMSAKAGFGEPSVDTATGKKTTPEHGEWTQDILRHTFASMTHEMHGTEHTIRQMGHVGTDILFQHYRARVTPEEAKLYWNLRPVVLTQTLLKPEMLLPELLSEYLQAITPERQDSDSQVLAVKHATMARSICTRFCGAYTKRRVSSVSEADVDAWLDGLGLSKGSRVQYRVGISKLYQFAIRQGYATGNPAINHGSGPQLDVAEPEVDNIIPMLAVAV